MAYTTIKFDINKLLVIKEVLTDVLLPIKGTKLTKQINDILYLIDIELEKYEKFVKSLREKYTKKDGDGNVIKYVFVRNDKPTFKISPDGLPVIYQEGYQLGANEFAESVVDTNDGKYLEEINDSLISLSIDTIDKTVLDSLYDTVLDGVNLSVLYGTIIK